MTSRIRLLQVCASLTAGGAERLVHGLVQQLDPDRFEIFVCGLSIIEGNKFQNEFERLGIPVYVIDAHKMYDPKLYNKLRRYIIEHHIDIIHTHLTSPDFVGRLVGYSLGIPVVSTLHNIPQDYERESFYRYWLERFTARRVATHLIAVSETIRQMFIKRWSIPEHMITTILNGVPMERFLNVPTKVIPYNAAQEPLVLTVGRLTEQKAQHVFIDAARIVLNTKPEVRFMIVGQGKLEQLLKAQVQRLGLAERIEFAGIRHDIPEVLAHADLFVLSSDWEGLPVSAIEAMAAARPVVLTDVGGVKDLVESGKDGILVAPGQPTLLAEAILSLLNDKARMANMATAARARVRDEFSMKTFAARHEVLYDAILAR